MLKSDENTIRDSLRISCWIFKYKRNLLITAITQNLKRLVGAFKTFIKSLQNRFSIMKWFSGLLSNNTVFKISLEMHIYLLQALAEILKKTLKWIKYIGRNFLEMYLSDFGKKTKKYRNPPSIDWRELYLVGPSRTLPGLTHDGIMQKNEIQESQATLWSLCSFGKLLKTMIKPEMFCFGFMKVLITSGSPFDLKMLLGKCTRNLKRRWFKTWHHIW